MNSLFMNDLGEVRFYIYHDAAIADEGFRLTKLKKGSGLVEEDGPSAPYQHVTTAIGYWADYVFEYDMETSVIKLS